MRRFDLSRQTSHPLTSTASRMAFNTRGTSAMSANVAQAGWQSLMLKAMVLSLLLVAIATANSVKAEEETLDYWLLAKYDANGDRIISADEISRKRERVFAMMDGNHDGEVSLEEYQWLDVRKREKIVAARFNKLDQDGDGVLTGQEYTAYAGAFFDIDSDGNGKLSTAEIKKLSQEREQAIKNTVDDHKCLWRFCYKTN